MQTSEPDKPTIDRLTAPVAKTGRAGLLFVRLEKRVRHLS